MSRVPRIRFKGFKEDWEQRKLGEIGSVAMCRRIFKYQTTESGDIPFFKIGSFGGTPDAFISKDLFESFKVKYPYPEKGDVLISASGSIGRTVVFTGKDEYFQDSNIVWLKHNNSIINSFLNYLYSTVKWAGIEGTTIKRLYNDNILKTEAIIPTLLEQQKISDYLDGINHLITLHQRKLEKLKIIKKSMLENFFPQNGEKTPKIRFSGFTEDWEQRKLGEVFEEYSEKNHSELPPLTIIQGGGTIRRDESDRALQYDRGSLSNYKMVNKDDFIVHLRSFEGGLEKANTTGIISPAYHTFSGENTDTTFYYTYFRSKKFIESDLKPHVYGIRDGRSIDIEGMKSINIPYTIFEEQSRIGEFIDLIDHLITLHQSKLDKLQKTKKSMLESMFV